MSLQALWWRSFFSSTKQLPQLPLPLWRGQDRDRDGTGSAGGSEQPGWGSQGSDDPRVPRAPSSRAPTVLPGVPTSPQLCTSLSPWDAAPLSRRALGKWTSTLGEHGVLLGVIPAGAGKGAVMGFCRG